MEKLIMLKYGELSTKKDNIGLFLKKLKDNITRILTEEEKVYFDKGRMFIESPNIDNTIKKVSKVFGIHELVMAYKIDTDYDNLKETVKSLVYKLNFKTFKVVTKRSDKTYPKTSMEISKEIGGVVLKNVPNIKVDVNNPEITINIEIRSNATYIYMESIKGLGGYPVGTMGKGLLMLSGGIDSPVSGYLAMKRGIKLECIYFESPPHTSLEAKEKVLSLARILKTYNIDMKVHIINLTKIQEAIYKNIPHEYLITILRRMMYRISAIVASKSNCKVLINGESIGQVASQTLTSMSAINEVVNIPVIRPVACFDKLEIIELAKKINTYETSILPFEDCCTIFVPQHPVINPTKEKCLEYEELIPYKELIYEAVKTHEVINIKDENKYEDLL